MGQVIFSRNPTGSISFGLFLVAISVFLWSTLDPLFGPLAIGCITAGVVVAVVLARRRQHPRPHLDPR